MKRGIEIEQWNKAHLQQQHIPTSCLSLHFSGIYIHVLAKSQEDDKKNKKKPKG